MLNHKLVRIVPLAAIVIVSLMLAGSAAAQGFVASSDVFPVQGARYEAANPVTYIGVRLPDGSTVDIELVALSLHSAVPVETVSLLRLGGGMYHVDSFFDVFTELSVDGGPDMTGSWDAEIVSMSLSGNDNTTGTFATEIISMSLSGNVGGTPVMIRESPSTASAGQTTITDLGGGMYHIDSFFDVFTELSVDGGDTWVAGSGPARLDLIPDPLPAPTLVAGINVDIHMDIPGVTANDFHVEGRIESGDPAGNWSQRPVLIDHIDGWFPNFDITIEPDLTAATQNWYIIKADWSGAEYNYCDILHLGLFFDVTCHNIIIDLIGYWTQDGVPIVDAPAAPPFNGGAVPIPGFEVQDMPTGDVSSVGQTFIIINDSHLYNGRGGIPLEIVQMDLAAVENREELERHLGPEPYRELNVNGRQSRLPWVPVISPIQLPVPLEPNSLYLVSLEDFDIVLPPGGFLIGRQLIQFTNNNQELERRWTWEIHEAHRAELGDAPDRTNSHGAGMTTYTAGVPANFPTVYAAGSPPHGPKHLRPRAVAFLGPRVSPEMEADIGPDADGINNIWPPLNAADQDGFDDCMVPPLVLPHCEKCAFLYTVNVINPNVDLYVNVWFDWNRDGDWDDTLSCGDLGAPEWAVQDQLLPAGSLAVGLNNVISSVFLAWHPAGADDEKIWMRITLSEQPWNGSGSGGSGSVGGYRFGETEDYYFLPITTLPEGDLGDAPDSSNSYGIAIAGPVPMTAYPKGGPPGIQAHYPTVFQIGSPPFGPKHLQPRAVAYLGENVSLEVEADTGLDEDAVNNIEPPNDLPDQDRYDDGLLGLPLHLPHCTQTKFRYVVNKITTTDVNLYFNAWLDFNRDGDWDDSLTCADGTLAPEWAVQNQLLSGLSPDLQPVESLPFKPWHPAASAGQKIWMRITLAEKPWSGSGAGVVGTGGSGPTTGYEYGETEDYYFRPKYPLISDLDLNGKVDFRDIAIIASEWLMSYP